MKAIDLIPKGIYCHGEIEVIDGMAIRTEVCPFWRKLDTRPVQENGFCILMQRGDWTEEGFGLLWDQCKECGINDDDEEFEAFVAIQNS